MIVKFDTTHTWRKDIQQKAGKIYSYYFVDINEITYCAEITGSYYCSFLYNRVENIDAYLIGNGKNCEYSKELFEIEKGNGDDTDMYVSKHTEFTIVADEIIPPKDGNYN